MPTVLALKAADATDALGGSLGIAIQQHLEPIRASGLHINLSGDLGAGKTALVRAILRRLGVQEGVKSPTFALLEPYTVSSLDFYHFDFYRLKEPDEFSEMGFREMFGPGRICAVEWPERAGMRLPTADVSIALTIDGDGRLATISTANELGEKCLREAMTKFEVSAGALSPLAPARSSSR